MTQEEEIILCSNCKGEGLSHHKELTDYHHGYYDTWTTSCWRCNGTGRLVKTVKTTFEPYEPKSPSRDA